MTYEIWFDMDFNIIPQKGDAVLMAKVRVDEHTAEYCPDSGPYVVAHDHAIESIHMLTAAVADGARRNPGEARWVEAPEWVWDYAVPEMEYDATALREELARAIYEAGDA